MIRKSTDWMRLLDERILENLNDDGPSEPSTLVHSKGINGSREEIQKRCKMLYQKGLIVPFSKKDYIISKAGEAYLDGEFDLEKDKIIEFSIEGIRYPLDHPREDSNEIITAKIPEINQLQSKIRATY